ncbi:hypothetical protein QYQ99_22660 [Comamonas testosteroni]|uniref:hypothetical protein n=1 Tax=Comamonas testosteroni TaxID=285 RepID=UPI00265DEE13|nr:hypothetical protein [Comamonas testosteroni]WKL15127.1 hypothetical protein QYQ99_22660 [Comamonas testosteroni]
MTDEKIANAQLLAVIRVPEEDRVQCQNPGCGHGVRAAVYIVRDTGDLMVLGSKCFERRYGSAKALGGAQYSSGSGGRQLSADERDLLVSNTELLLARFAEEVRVHLLRVQALEQERRRLEAKDAERRAEFARAARERAQSGRMDPREKLRLLRAEFGARKAVQQAMQQAAVDPISHPAVKLGQPPAWAAEVKQNGSFFCHLFKDESQWVVYQRQDGVYALRPWPDAKEGWDEALPPSLGHVQAELGYYRIADYLSFSMAVRKFSAGIRNTSNPAEIQHHFDLLNDEAGTAKS